MKTQSTILRTLQVAAMAVALIGLTRSSLAADPYTNISIYASQPELTVPEGQDGYFEFTVANITNQVIRIAGIDTAWRYEYPHGHPIFISGEIDDEVYSTWVTFDRSTPLFLWPNETITFRQGFSTRDLHPDGDVDIGTWEIWNEVIYCYAVNPDAISAYGSALVHVSDIPEPSTGAIWLLGAGLLCWRRWRR
jgi:hypothetical protein